MEIYEVIIPKPWCKYSPQDGTVVSCRVTHACQLKWSEQQEKKFYLKDAMHRPILELKSQSYDHECNILYV